MAQRTLACTGCHGKAGPRRSRRLLPAHRRQARRLPVQPAAEFSRRTPALRADGAAAGPAVRRLPAGDRAAFRRARPALPAAAAAAAARRRCCSAGQALALQGDAPRAIPACAQCHGAALTGVPPNTPGLLGLPRDYLNAQLGAWRTGQRRAHAPDCMAQIARQLRPARPRRGDRLARGPAACRPTRRPAPSLARPPQIACGSAALPAGSPAAMKRCWMRDAARACWRCWRCSCS